MIFELVIVQIIKVLAMYEQHIHTYPYFRLYQSQLFPIQLLVRISLHNNITILYKKAILWDYTHALSDTNFVTAIQHVQLLTNRDYIHHCTCT